LTRWTPDKALVEAVWPRQGLWKAMSNMREAGYAPRLVLGDGALGWADEAPYDRVHVTVGVREVPYAWVEQVRPGGVIAFPWMPDFEPGHKVCLTVGDDGTAIGRLAGGARFMMLRDQRAPVAPKYEGSYRKRKAALDPRRIFRAGYGADVAIAGCLPDVSAIRSDAESSEAWAWTGGSGAHVVGFDVEQFGDRDLWDELEAAFFQWLSWGQPERNRFGLTVTPEGQHVWLDKPDNPIG
jgi:hypothetical protein